ncbi:FIST signal transduction protein [Actinoplanes sp. HUAS TT8]|uniref:FIST signal transduction protein n=1 Tax=Actinoplanes sp. HUAS TT8 TaxID=3447453 RepID=UPI003F5211BF
MHPSRWFGTGFSTATDAAGAGAQATEEAVGGRDAAAVIVMTSREDDLPALLDGVRGRIGPGTTVVGTTTCGEVASGGAVAGGVAVVALGGDGFTVSAALSRDAAGRQRAAGVEVAEAVTPTGRAHEVLMMMPDGLIGRQHDVIRGAYSVLGAEVPLAGACGGNLTFTKAHQFVGGRDGIEIVSGGVLAMLIGSDGPLGVGTAHGWRAIGEPMHVTAAEDNRVLQLDNQPALDVYLRRLAADDSVTADPGEFFTFTHAHPLGLARRSGADIRVVQAAHLDDRSMTFFADVPQGGLVWLMETDEKSLINGAADSCTEAIAALGGAAPIGVLEFDCVVRKLQLGENNLVHEVNGLHKPADGVPVAGYYSMGEVARVAGVRGMHHMTSVSLAFG